MMLVILLVVSFLIGKINLKNILEPLDIIVVSGAGFEPTTFGFKGQISKK